jgi:Leucine-rich repeat (LRR) protein
MIVKINTMKQIFTLLFFLVYFITPFAQTTYVPDDNFEQQLINLGLDDVLDDYVLTNNILYLGYLDISNRGIYDLTGIEDFSGLYYLNVNGNHLTEIDIRNSIGLQELYCSGNQIISLNLSKNVLLNNFHCTNNQLSVLNIQNGNNLNMLNFNAENNPNLTCIQVDDVAYSDSNWNSIDVQTSFSLDCGQTFVPDNNFEQALINLGYDNVLNDYVSTGNINMVTSLNVSNKNISELTGIEDFISLQTLICSNNQLESIDISQNIVLSYLDCNFNILTSLDVSQNLALTLLACRANQISGLDVSNNILLEYFSCRDNLLNDLDVSQNSNLLRLWCFNNQLTSLNVKNGNNTNILNSDFDATNNPNLTCIQIDNLAWNTTNWTNIDSQAYFSEDCNSTYVPDDNFEQALIDLGYDSGALNNYVTTSNIENLTFLNVSNKNISDLTGIEDFTALTNLSCYDNFLTTLNISNNIALTDLLCFNNQLTALDVNFNLALDNLRCENNQLTTLAVTNNTVLSRLDCSNNQIGNLDLSQNSSLSIIKAYNNQLTYLDVRNGNNYNIYNSDFKVTGNPNLYCINVDDLAYCDANWGYIDSQSYFSENCLATYVPDDNFEQALIDLGYDSGALDNYVLTANINTISSLDISGKYISDLTGIEDFTALTSLTCSSNQLTTLDVSQNTLLTDIICNSNQLTSLDVSQNTALINLNCQNNQLTSLDVSQNTALNNLNCKVNLLTSINLIATITELDCRYNQLIDLDVTQNTALLVLNCSNNLIENINVSQNALLTALNCKNNQLEKLDVANGNNLNFLYFFSTNNPNLTCINVDDVAWSTANWTGIDAQSYFSTECNITNIPDANFEQALIDLGHDSGVVDGFVLTENINSITNLTVSNRNISDLTGIEDFTSLTALDCSSNQLTTLNITQNTNLYFFLCNLNNLTNLDITQNPLLEIFYCGNNQLTTINTTNNPLLKHFRCSNNLLTDIDTSQNTVLTQLSCSYNNISNLNLSQNTALNILDCINNQLTALDLSNNISLLELWCYDNQINNLDIASCISLTNLRVKNNQLTDLNTSNCPSLIYLYGENNLITNLDVSANIALQNLIVTDNLLTDLNISQNISLAYLYTQNNTLTNLNVANGNNVNMVLIATGNPYLNCIQVDNAAWSTTNWLGVDSHSSFSENCSLAVNEFNLENSIVIYPNPAKDNFSISSNRLSRIGTITIYNSIGKMIYFSNTITESVDASQLSNGIYTLKLTNNNQVIIKKIAIKK